MNGWKPPYLLSFLVLAYFQELQVGLFSSVKTQKTNMTGMEHFWIGSSYIFNQGKIIKITLEKSPTKITKNKLLSISLQQPLELLLLLLPVNNTRAWSHAPFFRGHQMGPSLEGDQTWFATAGHVEWFPSKKSVMLNDRLSSWGVSKKPLHTKKDGRNDPIQPENCWRGHDIHKLNNTLLRGNHSNICIGPHVEVPIVVPEVECNPTKAMCHLFKHTPHLLDGQFRMPSTKHPAWCPWAPIKLLSQGVTVEAINIHHMKSVVDTVISISDNVTCSLL